MDIIKSKIKRNETQCKSSIIITHLPYVYLIILPCKVPEKSVTKFYNEKKENWTNKERKKRMGSIPYLTIQPLIVHMCFKFRDFSLNRS